MAKTKQKYNEETIQKALDEIKRGVPKKAAARKYMIPRSTLQFRLGKNFKKTRHGPNTYLTPDEETTLVDWIVDCHKKGFPRRKDDISASVKKFLDDNPRPNPFKANSPGVHWYNSFFKRHPILTIRTPEGVTNASGNISEKDIRKWFHDIELYLKEKGYFDILTDPTRVYNGDETCFQLCPKSGKVLAPKGSKNIYEIDQGNAKENITVMFTFSASGEVTPPMVIYPYRRMPQNIAESVPEGWGIGISDNGWMKSEVFFEYVANILYPSLQKKNLKFPIIYFVDGHKTHLTYQISNLCKKLKIILIALYPNATRILQPADVSCFRPLKAYWKYGVLKWRRENPYTNLNKANFAPILKNVIAELSNEKISNGFTACGLCPWNPNSIDFSKCLGKQDNKENSQQEKTILSKRSLSYEDFLKIVGYRKTQQLKEMTDEEIPDASEDFQILFKLFKEFNSSSSTDDEEKNIWDDKVTKPTLEAYEADGAINTENEPINISMSMETAITVTPNKETGEIEEASANEHNAAIYSMGEIMNMPVILLADNVDNLETNEHNKEINLDNSHIENYLLWQKTPERSGKRQTERLPFVVTSTAFKNICEEKLRKNTEKEKEKAMKLAARLAKTKLKEENIRNKKCKNNQNKTRKSDANRNKGTIANADKTSNDSKHIKVISNILLNSDEIINENIRVCNENNNAEENAHIEKLFSDKNQDHLIVSKSLTSKNKNCTITKAGENEKDPKQTQMCTNILLERNEENNIKSKPYSHESNIKAEPYKRNLFLTNDIETSETPRDSPIENNIIVGRGICFICTRSIYMTNLGIKCKKCTRIYHKTCLISKDLYKENFICLTCAKK